MGDTTNWEFAAAVAAVSIGLGGLLLFTLIGTIGSWQVFGRASRAAAEASKASQAVQDLARYLANRETARSGPPAANANDTAASLAALQAQADAIAAQQALLRETVDQLMESGVLRTDGPGRQLNDLEVAIRRLDEHLSRIAAAVASLSQR